MTPSVTKSGSRWWPRPPHRGSARHVVESDLRPEPAVQQRRRGRGRGQGLCTRAAPTKPLLPKAYRERYFPCLDVQGRDRHRWSDLGQGHRRLADLSGGDVVHPAADQCRSQLRRQRLRWDAHSPSWPALCNSSFAQMAAETTGPDPMIDGRSGRVQPAGRLDCPASVGVPDRLRSGRQSRFIGHEDTPKLAQTAISQNDVPRHAAADGHGRRRCQQHRQDRYPHVMAVRSARNGDVVDYSPSRGRSR